jgi:hypothetical protein
MCHIEIWVVRNSNADRRLTQARNGIDAWMFNSLGPIR